MIHIASCPHGWRAQARIEPIRPDLVRSFRCLTDLPERPEGDERLLWLAEHGHLEPAELAKIARTSADAKARIGTIAEVSADVKTAALYGRVTKALP